MTNWLTDLIVFFGGVGDGGWGGSFLGANLDDHVSIASVHIKAKNMLMTVVLLPNRDLTPRTFFRNMAMEVPSNCFYGKYFLGISLSRDWGSPPGAFHRWVLLSNTCHVQCALHSFSLAIITNLSIDSKLLPCLDFTFTIIVLVYSLTKSCQQQQWDSQILSYLDSSATLLLLFWFCCCCNFTQIFMLWR